jgi:2-methylcitrate dehydratase
MVAIAIFSADPAMRRSLEQLPREDSTLSIVGVVDDPTAISLLIDQNRVNVVLADMPLRERLADWRIRHNQTAFVIFVGGADEEDSLDALYAGARAILPRTAKPDEIITAIKAVTNGLAVLPGELLPALLSGASFVGELLDDKDPDRVRLTPRELEVLAAMADGVSNKAIARRAGNLLSHRQVSRRRHPRQAQCGYAAAAGMAKALALSRDQIANAVAISGTANNALRVTRTGTLSHWKGLAYPNTGMAATHAALLAAHGITGPEAVFEGNKGFMEVIAGPFEIDWLNEDLERVRLTILKRHNAEIHAQSALDAALDIRARPHFAVDAVRSVRLKTFGVAHRIIGGGEEGDKRIVRTKEDADHSLPYMLAVALIDGEVQPEQYAPERIAAADVQQLLRKVTITPESALSARFPQRLPAELEVELEDGTIFSAQREDYHGFHTNPLDWTAARAKFDRVTHAFISAAERDAIANVIATLDERPITALTRLLGAIPCRAAAA